jgi:hypothetical protein
LLDKELQRSHLMAKSLYKKTRSDDPKQPHPLVRTSEGVRPSSYQVRDYVFCWDCEQRFSREGEDYMMRLVAHRDKFPLLEMLETTGSGLSRPPVTAYRVSGTPLVDRAKIGYFAASVFWRASVHTWKQDDGKPVSIDLGVENNEELRQYLLGRRSFPTNAGLLTTLCTDTESQNMFLMPGANVKNDRVWLVVMRGFTFFFSIGAQIPTYISRYCTMNSAGRWIMVRDCSQRHKIWELK